MSDTVNIVELMAEDQHDSPCRWGNIVDHHACYCHHPDGPRKCPIWRMAGESDPSAWHRVGCRLFEARQHGEVTPGPLQPPASGPRTMTVPGRRPAGMRGSLASKG